ncbi:MAG TPA: hypothetical protein VGW78_01225 [Candidatus Babeliales bacterium]|jgi:uncharacterized membrane protein (Fun14 family)|nr:hypothetical protein [Candidatus Babeliales bacterium]
MTQTEMPNQTGALQSVKEKLNVDTIVNQIKDSKDTIIEIGLYAIIGFFAGYLIKRYSSFLAMMMLFVGGLIVLVKFEIIAIVINWEYIYQQLGMQPYLLNTDTLMPLAWEWARANSLLVASAVIGFLFGLRMG